MLCRHSLSFRFHPWKYTGILLVGLLVVLSAAAVAAVADET